MILGVPGQIRHTNSEFGAERKRFTGWTFAISGRLELQGTESENHFPIHMRNGDPPSPSPSSAPLLAVEMVSCL